MTPALDEIDLAQVRRVANNASGCIGMLSIIGDQLLAVLAILDLAAELPADVAPDYADMMEHATAGLETSWRQLFDAADVPQRPLPRLPSPTRH